MSDVYSNAIAELVARLNYHADPDQSDRLLSGWKWYDKPLEHPDGMDDFPAAQLFIPSLNESYRSARLGEGMLSVPFTVSVARAVLP